MGLGDQTKSNAIRCLLGSMSMTLHQLDVVFIGARRFDAEVSRAKERLETGSRSQTGPGSSRRGFRGLKSWAPSILDRRRFADQSEEWRSIGANVIASPTDMPMAVHSSLFGLLTIAGAQTWKKSPGQSHGYPPALDVAVPDVGVPHVGVQNVVA